MKYIATSSLNIDNILSTESISPFPFYDTRSFGYNKFIQIDELKNCDSILLFSEIPYFEIEDEQRENHPMVVQIDDEYQLKNVQMLGNFAGCEVYAYEKTIRITPMNTKFLFFSEKARILSYQNCLDSKMCKLINYFNFQTIHPTNIYLIDLVSKMNILPYSMSLVNIDNQYDRVKGFIYAYSIGEINSLSSNLSKMLKIQKRIYDIVASIKSNGGRSNEVFDKELSHLDQEYGQLDPNITRAKKGWKEFVENHKCSLDGLNNLLHSLTLEVDAKRIFCQQRGIFLRRTLPEYKSWELEKYSEDISVHIKSMIYQERENNKENMDLCSQLDINPDYSLAMMIKNDVNNSLFNKILNNIIWNNVIIDLDALRINRFDVATQVTQIVSYIIEESGKEWKGSPEQLYFHHLRQNIKEFVPFNLLEIDNIIFQSLAAFLLKGEDFDALINYLENNSISTYQYALALWGATLGYVQIPRSIIFSYVDKKTFVKLYKDVYKLMHKRVFDGDLIITSNEMSIKQDSVYDVLPQEESSKEKVWKAWMKVRKGLKNKDKLEEDLKRVLKMTDKNIRIPSLLELLDESVWKRKNQPWQKLHEQLGLICSMQKQKKEILNQEKSLPLFDDDICSLEALKELPEFAVKRILSNWNYTAQENGFRTEEHIKYFINLCKKEGRGESKHKELKGLFTESIAQKILTELKKSDANR